MGADVRALGGDGKAGVSLRAVPAGLLPDGAAGPAFGGGQGRDAGGRRPRTVSRRAHGAGRPAPARADAGRGAGAPGHGVLCYPDGGCDGLRPQRRDAPRLRGGAAAGGGSGGAGGGVQLPRDAGQHDHPPARAGGVIRGEGTR